MSRSTLSLLTTVFFFFMPPLLSAHCDTLAGPVVADAKLALAQGDITPVLKWVKPEFEQELQAAFAQTRKVRTQSKDAQELADNYFFETVVRLHRAGEGAPFTGVKHEPPEAIVAATDTALTAGNSDPLLRSLQEDVARGLEQRFARVVAARAHMNDSVTAGREYVAAYVELTHYVEALHDAASAGHAHDVQVAKAP
jgi:uncharacterized protein DUF6448